MAGKHGVQALTQLINTVKVGSIAILQQVQKDGFQGGDILAPMESQVFQTEFKKAKSEFTKCLPELLELDGGDFWDLGMVFYGVYKDMRTEWKPAFQKVAEQRKALKPA